MRTPSLLVARRYALAPLAFVAAASAGGCEMPTPLAQAEPIGEFPQWGQNFATPEQQPASLLGAGQGTVVQAPEGAGGNVGNTDVPAGTASPGSTGDWSGGDEKLGKVVWQGLCLRCHGANGEGGALPGGEPVPALNSAAWQAKVEDREIARAIALGKGAMPSYMKELDREQLQGVIAYIRTLKP